MDLEYTDALEQFDAELAALRIRGQWQCAAPSKMRTPRPEPGTEPSASGAPRIWKWDDIHPLIDKACSALPERFTARRGGERTWRPPGEVD